MSHWSDKLKSLGACEKGLEWARKQPSFKTAWKKCQHAPWMIWICLRAQEAGAVGWPTYLEIYPVDRRDNTAFRNGMSERRRASLVRKALKVPEEL